MPYEITKNEFFGVSCDCINSSSPYDCSHSVIVSDSKVMELINNSLITNDISYS